MGEDQTFTITNKAASLHQQHEDDVTVVLEGSDIEMTETNNMQSFTPRPTIVGRSRGGKFFA